MIAMLGQKHVITKDSKSFTFFYNDNICEMRVGWKSRLKTCTDHCHAQLRLQGKFIGYCCLQYLRGFLMPLDLLNA